ncbi:hypothetical protein BDM02DRAFT_2748116 [Thelephora ganbajun]|uniref:Uncharacterized protein n=1 Tax=Thelephora ganbajun TaxID=370292 RepID=A0ACB6ZSA7_THEGA|nr:hypothetical protein BDM02DRAFT_2748116 [Thelephora ganbajun]
MSTTQSQTPPPITASPPLPTTVQDQLPPNSPLSKVSNPLSPQSSPFNRSPHSSPPCAVTNDSPDDFQTNAASLPVPTLSAQPDSTIPPNVYINGLPPNFPEEQLYNMTKEFGAVLSVRTFTRHVSERPTGYGFVLFQSLDSAQRCIETLRKYRNLHPSLSKQVHKIPGTPYAKVQAPEVITPSKKDSFKSRMEQFKDETSTNLYIEGLPLTIDEPTLAALMAPHKIMSSRLFQTRLSHPPRTIAFVRLESRSAAEETIERLHGRMVRGWNDPGCRISVRFADTAEQRELRRQERLLQGDQSPARLTMAQAALLNMQGSQALSQRNQRFPDASFGSPSPTQTNAATNTYISNLTRESFGRRPDHLNGARNRRTGSVSTSARARNGYTPAEELYLAMHAQRVQARGVPSHLSSSELSSSQVNLPGVASANQMIEHASDFTTPASEPFLAVRDYSYGGQDSGVYDARSLASDLGGLSISRFQPLGRSSPTTITPHLTSTNDRLRPSQAFNNSSNSYENVFDNKKFTGGHVSAFKPTGATKGTDSVSDHRSTYADKQDNTDSPLASPALTYSSHGRTPSTLSPATPFFGTFSGGEGFEGLPAVGSNFKSKERDVANVASSTLEGC